MSVSEYDAYEDEGAALEYERELVEEALSNISGDRAKQYLVKHGDAIEARVNELKAMASLLLDSGYYGASIVASVTTVELAIRFFVLRPICQGMFLEDQWADELLNRIFGRTTQADRELLPMILNGLGIDLKAIKFVDGRPAWLTYDQTLRRTRNHFVHQGSAVSRDEATLAIEFVSLFVRDIVRPVVYKHGMDCWGGDWFAAGGGEGCRKSPFGS